MPTRSFNLADLFEGAVDTIGDRPALITGGSEVATRRWTYAELDDRANRMANHLASLGVGPGDRVGVHLFNSGDFVETMLAIFKLRAVMVNANYRYVAEELRYVFDDAGVVVVVTEADLAERVHDAETALPDLRTVITRGVDYDGRMARSSPERPDVGPRSGDDLYLLYTGGTTGMPKGVMWRHEDLFFGALGGAGSPRAGVAPLERAADIGAWAAAGTPVTRRFSLCPLIHGGAQWTSLTALLTGGTSLLSTDRHLDAAAALRFATDEQAELLVVIGDAIARPLAAELASSGELYDLSPMKMILSSGAILSPAVKAELAEMLPHVKMVDRFGASETGAQGRIKPGQPGGPPRLIADENTQVLDEDFQPVVPGSDQVGKLARRGSIPLGYWNDPDKTAATFPTVDGVRWSVPGDMATVDADGVISVLGRGSMVINTGGEKVFPEEVEKAVKSHPSIFDAIVVGVPDERFGRRVAAVVQLRPGEHGAPSVQELHDHCLHHIAGYKCPRDIVVTDRVQRTVMGKADYKWATQLATAATT